MSSPAGHMTPLLTWRPILELPSCCCASFAGHLEARRGFCMISTFLQPDRLQRFDLLPLVSSPRFSPISTFLTPCAFFHVRCEDFKEAICTGLLFQWLGPPLGLWWSHTGPSGSPAGKKWCDLDLFSQAPRFRPYASGEQLGVSCGHAPSLRLTFPYAAWRASFVKCPALLTGPKVRGQPLEAVLPHTAHWGNSWLFTAHQGTVQYDEAGHQLAIVLQSTG
ncbi:hypothetical protein SRHO_G00338250 [Serrasalmus rhombeus]